MRLPPGLQAILLLAIARPDGALVLEPPPGTPPEAVMAMAARSFRAILVCLPPLLWLHLPDRATGPHPLASLLLDLEAFVIGWAGFAVLSHRIARRLGRAQRWPLFIAAWNWCNVLQYVALLLAGLPVLFGAPDVVVEFIWFATAVWVIWLEWSATRLLLRVPAFTAAALVMLDLSLGMMLAAITG